MRSSTICLTLCLSALGLALPQPQINESFTTLAEIPAINLDCLDGEVAASDLEYLQEQEILFNNRKVQTLVSQQLGHDEFSIEARVVYLEDPPISQVDMSSIWKYEVSKRDSFNYQKMKYINEKNPKSVTIFKDTNTIMVPGDEILKGENGGSTFEYVEIDLADTRSQFSPELIPATGCLTFPSGKGSGSISVSYSVGVSLKPSGGVSASLAMPLAIDYSLGLSVSYSASYSTSYSCSTDDGKAVRLFYKVSIVETVGRKRSFIYDAIKRNLYRENWMNIDREKYLTDHAPMYFCGTEDKIELICNAPGIEHTNENGDTIKSIIGNSGSHAKF